MNYLLDTCVISEFIHRVPHQKVTGWLANVEEERLFLSVLTIGEIQRGIQRLAASNRKTELSGWLEESLLRRFAGRILPLDTQTMILWGSLTARSEAQGRPLPLMDSLIAATAQQHRLTVVTRNSADFLPCGIDVLNPWD